MARFVLLLHDCPASYPRPTHCDLMFESGGVLQTWVLDCLPRDWTRLLPFAVGRIEFALSNTIDVEKLNDHRLAYLDYEGAVSSGRGTVRRLDAGTYTTHDEGMTFSVEGSALRGEIVLRPTSSFTGWQLTFQPSVQVTC